MEAIDGIASHGSILSRRRGASASRGRRSSRIRPDETVSGFAGLFRGDLNAGLAVWLHDNVDICRSATTPKEPAAAPLEATARALAAASV
ncbi:MAG TPA: hypothetical protein VFU81_08005, partial [Thermomicrobiales bacterium]|nr:hypothetical protein [Thermomicrobiales bacterium]